MPLPTNLGRIRTWNEHIDDEIINNGTNGLKTAIQFLEVVAAMLNNNSTQSYNVSTKWDGAPAIICGINPANGRFFLGTKGVFAKNAKLNYTEADIDKNHPGEGLNKKLKIALKYLPKLNIQGVLQGDLMFTKSDLKKQVIDDVEYITFQPNTIVYAVPSNSELAKKILKADMGIVFHTRYTGKTLESMTASFNVNISSLKSDPSIWVTDPFIKDFRGTISLTKAESDKVKSLIKKMKETYKKVSKTMIEKVTTDDNMKLLLKTFNNAKVRRGEQIDDPKKYAEEWFEWVSKRIQGEIDALKKEESKAKKALELMVLRGWVDENRTSLEAMYECMKYIVEAKIILLRPLQSLGSFNMFIRTADGFKTTAPEGFVISNQLSNKAVKLVDRMEFSRNNFLATKEWTK